MAAVEPEFELAYTDRNGNRITRFSETCSTPVTLAEIHSWTDVHIVYRFNTDIHYTIERGRLVRLPPPRDARSRHP